MEKEKGKQRDDLLRKRENVEVRKKDKEKRKSNQNKGRFLVTKVAKHSVNEKRSLFNKKSKNERSPSDDLLRKRENVEVRKKDKEKKKSNQNKGRFLVTKIEKHSVNEKHVMFNKKSKNERSPSDDLLRKRENI